MSQRDEATSALMPAFSPKRGGIVGRWFGWQRGRKYQTVVGPKRQRAGRTPGRYREIRMA